MSVTAERRAAVRVAYDYRCGYCHVPESDIGGQLQIDHYRPCQKGEVMMWTIWSTLVVIVIRLRGDIGRKRVCRTAFTSCIPTKTILRVT
jgi:hypothetical protein